MKIIIDLDGTLTENDPGVAYPDKPVNWAVVERLREYKSLGYQITVFTARNMRTYEGNIDLIRANTLPIIEDWLARHEIPHDEILIGKPWCGIDGFYVDDRALRPSEFANMTPDQARNFLNGNKY